jgi:hypothetical protein
MHCSCELGAQICVTALCYFLEINAEKTKYMIMFHHQDSGQNQNTRIANDWFENVAKFRCLGTTLSNQNIIHDESVVD